MGGGGGGQMGLIRPAKPAVIGAELAFTSGRSQIYWLLDIQSLSYVRSRRLKSKILHLNLKIARQKVH